MSNAGTKEIQLPLCSLCDPKGDLFLPWFCKWWWTGFCGVLDSWQGNSGLQAEYHQGRVPLCGSHLRFWLTRVLPPHQGNPAGAGNFRGVKEGPSPKDLLCPVSFLPLLLASYSCYLSQFGGGGHHRSPCSFVLKLCSTPFNLFSVSSIRSWGFSNSKPFSKGWVWTRGQANKL